MTDEQNTVPVCEVGGSKCYLTEIEAITARLDHGQEIIFNGIVEIVDFTYFYDGIIIKTKSGGSIFPSLGDKFEVKI